MIKKHLNNLSKGEAAGIFQLESNGMASVLRQFNQINLKK